MADTKIQWCDKTWSPITGCTPVSPGCLHCWAKKMANRLKGRCGYDRDNPFQVTFHADKLREPLHHIIPRRVFVCSMGDLFHENTRGDWQRSVRAIIERSRDVFLLLTKRPENIKKTCFAAPPKNVWLGVSCENQEWAEKRIPLLLQIPAAIRWVSLEPLLGPINLSAINILKQEETRFWVVVGCESGPGRRLCKLEWVRDIVQQCKTASVAVFVKQLEINGKVSHEMSEWPEDLRIREYPNVSP